MLVVYTPSHLCRSVAGCFSYTVETRYKQSAPKQPSRNCASSRLSLSFLHTTTTHCTTYTFSSRLPSSTCVVPSLSPGAGVCWRGVRSPVVVVPLPPGWCGWHSGFSQRQVPSVPFISWFVPSSVGFLPHLLHRTPMFSAVV
ncbi:hypothetical protein GQ42DRAFT_164191, partial [Ramicandelaber brevisporus]